MPHNTTGKFIRKKDHGTINTQTRRRDSVVQKPMKDNEKMRGKQEQPRPVFPIESNGIVVDDATVVSMLKNSTRDASSANNKATTAIDEDACSMLAARLSAMSLEERTEGIHELHGVVDFENETPNMLRDKLDEMTRVADSFEDVEELLPYRMALAMDEKHVEKMKLWCLRADSYDCNKAAARVVSFFAFKRVLFGDEKLTRDITQQDFEGDDKIFLESGGFQLLPERDRAGRAVVLVMGDHTADYTFDTLCRAVYYIFMAATRDEEIQKRGVVFIYDLTRQSKFRTDRPYKVAAVFWLLPTRLAALHMCCSSPLHTTIASVVTESLEPHYLCRCRNHNGSRKECVYSLMTFGIPKDLWPFSDAEFENLDIEHHSQWLETQRNREASLLQQQLNQPIVTESSSPSTNTTNNDDNAPNHNNIVSNNNNTSEIAVPGPMDIVLGRGKRSKSSAGYLRLRNLVEDHLEAYNNSERFEKTVVVDFIIRELRKSGCRFVRQTPQGIVPESDDAARDKVAHAFRDTRRARKAGNNNNGNGGMKRSISDA